MANPFLCTNGLICPKMNMNLKNKNKYGTFYT